METLTNIQLIGTAHLNLSKQKVEHLLNLKKITTTDIEGLTQTERRHLAETCTQMLQELTGAERDSFIDRIDLIIPAGTKSDIWEHNHSAISSAVSRLMAKDGLMPTKNAIAEETGLSRQTVAKHFKEYKRHPEFTAEMEQFKFMAPSLLAHVYKHALSGDMRAAKLYLQMAGTTGKQQAGTVVNEQNNYIQVNNTILSRENLERLTADQLNQIESIINKPR